MKISLRLLGSVSGVLLVFSTLCFAQNALPPLLQLDAGSPVQNIGDWHKRRGELFEHMQTEVYGHALPATSIEQVSAATAENDSLQANVTQAVLEFPDIGGKPRIDITRFEPLNVKTTVQILLVTDECSAAESLALPPPDRSSCDDLIKDYRDGVKEGMQRGIAFVFVQVTSLFPDSSKTYPAAIAPWVAEGDSNPPGALIAWASITSAIRKLEAQSHPERQQWVMGFSRFGKVAALALALDPEFKGGVLHMSGSLGATLSRGNDRETLSSIAANYPHWINSRLRGDTNPDHLTTDQHALIALAAPRPLLVNDGDFDLWSNPPLSLKSVEAASEVWTKLYGKLPLLTLSSSDKTTVFSPGQRLVHKNFGQVHSLLEGDWNIILSFVGSFSGAADQE